jgi:CPA2 family monovalent cation:H+ antiporter-2
LISLGYGGIAVLFAAAAIVSIVFKKLRQPLILGYIVAGVLSASFLTSDTNLIALISDLGITLLAFTMGMELSLKVLKEIGKNVIIAGVIELLLMLPAGYIISVLLGWSPITAIFFASAFALTSTTVVMKTMKDCRETLKSYSDLVLGLLVVEDLLTVGILAILSSLTSHRTFGLLQLLEIMGGMAFFAVVSLILAINVIPRVINHIVNFGSDEIIVITSMGLCFALALFAKELGFSFVIGAFIVGVAVAESDHKDRIHSRMVPIRDVFLAVFFVSIGTLIQTSYVITLLPIAIVLGLVFILWKFVSVTFGFTFMGYGLRNASYVGIAAGAIGEFSFVIGRLGLQFGFFTQQIYTLIVLISAVTIVILPQTIKRNERIYNAVRSKTPSGVILYTLAIRGFLDNLLKQIVNPVKMEKPSRAFLLTFVLNVMVIVSILVMTKYFVSYTSAMSSKLLLDLTLLMFGYIVVVVLLLYASLNTLIKETESFFDGTDIKSSFALKLVKRLLQALYIIIGYVVIASSITSVYYFAPVTVLISVVVSGLVIFLLWKGISDLSISIPGASQKAGKRKSGKSDNETLIELMLR